MKKILAVCLVTLLLLTGCVTTPKTVEHIEYKPYEQTFHERTSIYEAQYNVVISNPLPEVYEYEIPEEYQKDVFAIIDIIDNYDGDYCVYSFYDLAVAELESYLRLYYSDGYDQLYPDFSCACLFIHSYREIEENGHISYSINLDLEHCRKIKQECITWKEACMELSHYLDEVVSELDLNGYVVHDLKEVHDYICKTVKYDYEETNLYNFYMLGMLNKQTLICQGYSDAMHLICKTIGLDCYIDGGMVGGIGHAWNYVVINGDNYYIDSTWNDGDIITYKYFLVSKEFMEATGHEFEEIGT